MTVYACYNWDSDTIGASPSNVNAYAGGGGTWTVQALDADNVAYTPSGFSKAADIDATGAGSSILWGQLLQSVGSGIVRIELIGLYEGVSGTYSPVALGRLGDTGDNSPDIGVDARVLGGTGFNRTGYGYKNTGAAWNTGTTGYISPELTSLNWTAYQFEIDIDAETAKAKIIFLHDGTSPSGWDDCVMPSAWVPGSYTWGAVNLYAGTARTNQIAQMWFADDSEAFPDGTKQAVTASVAIAPSLGTIEVAGHDPVVRTGHVVVVPSLGSLVVSGLTPAVTATKTPPTGGTIEVILSNFIRMATKASLLSLFKDGEQLTGGRKWRTFIEGVVTKDELDDFVRTASAAATAINTDTTNFDGLLSSTDTTVQKALDTLDDITITDHGSLTGLYPDDDHPQYLDETRHLAIKGGNPHAVTHTEVGSSSEYWNANKIRSIEVDYQGNTPSAGTVLVGYTTGGVQWTLGDHGDIAGLGDDDHTQYVLEDGTRNFSGQESFEAGLKTDTIDEYSADTGVTIDSVLLNDDSVTAASASIGDGTNDVDISSVGIYLEGTATMWDDLRISSNAFKLGTSNDPGFSVFKTNGSGSQGVFLYWFDPASEEEIYFVAQMPHTWDEGTNIEPHVHWVPADTAAGAGTDVCWGLEYTWQNINGTFGNTTIIYADEQTNGATETLTDGKHYITEFSAIDATGKTMSSMLICRLFRDADSVGGTDDYDDDAGLLEVDFHYQVNSLGSKEELVKGP